MITKSIKKYKRVASTKNIKKHKTTKGCKKAYERYQNPTKEAKEKNDNISVNNMKISKKIRNKGLVNIEITALKSRKMLHPIGT